MPDISERLRMEVQQYAQEIGYSVNSAARSLKSRRSGLLGIGMGSFTNPFFQDVTYALCRSIKQAGFTPVLVEVESALEAAGRAAKGQSPDVRIDGLILLEGWYDLHLTDAQVTFLDRKVAPTIFRGNLQSDHVLDQVHVDWYASAQTLTRHLIELGHRKIGIIRGVGGSAEVREESDSDKTRGTIDELQAHGLQFDPRNHIVVPTSLGQARDATARLISHPDRPTAIICHTDYLAVGAIRALTEAGLEVPDDISVAGFNDIELGRFLPTSLTTISHDRTGLADELVKRLVSRINGTREPECFQTEVHHRLVLRESTAPLGPVPQLKS